MEVSMSSGTNELWMTLCEQATREHDSDRLLELMNQINDLLEQKENHLKQKRLPQLTVGHEC
jgi:hypothetical protein